MPPNKKEKTTLLENTILYTEINKRNLRLLIIAIVSLLIGLGISIPSLLDRSIFFVIFAGILVTFSIYPFLLVYKRNENIYNHPDMKKFLKWENYGDYVIVMDEELKKGKKIEFSNVFFTNSFFFMPSFYRFNWIHFSEICWAYNHVTQHYTNFIPTGKTYEVHIHTDNGGVMIIKTNKDEDILPNLIKLAPFAYYGYSDDLKNAWNKDTLEFIKTVKYRLQQLLKKHKK